MERAWWCPSPFPEHAAPTTGRLSPRLQAPTPAEKSASHFASVPAEPGRGRCTKSKVMMTEVKFPAPAWGASAASVDRQTRNELPGPQLGSTEPMGDELRPTGEW